MSFLATWLPLSLIVLLSLLTSVSLYFGPLNTDVKWLLWSLLGGLILSLGLLIGTLMWILMTQDEFVVLYSLWRVLVSAVVLGGAIALLGLGVRALHRWIFFQPL